MLRQTRVVILKSIFVGVFFIIFIAPVTYFFNSLGINIPLIGTLALALWSGPMVTFGWVACAGIAADFLFPFPDFSFVGALLITFFIIYLVRQHIISGHTLPGVAALVFVGSIIFELALFSLTRLMHLGFEGWVVHFSYTYTKFVVVRIMLLEIIVVILFLLLRRFSSRFRGIVAR